MAGRPTEDDLRAFVVSMLSNLDKQLREPEVIDEAIRSQQDMWTRLYRASFGFEISEESSP